MNVEFCNSKAFKVESNELRDKIFQECDKLFGFELKRDYFPGAQPVAVEIKDIKAKLQNEKYMVCEKSDGERGVLLLLNLNNKPMCFMINRNNDIFFLDLSFKKEIYEGTVLDGEIIKTKNGTWNYLMHDCMIYNGTNFMEKPHLLRYACIIDLICKRYVNKETDCVNLKTKLFYVYGPKIETTWDHINKTTENKIDGLIFTPVYQPIKFGRDYNLLKWKELETITIDFLIRNVKNKINLYGIRKNKLYIFTSFGKDHTNYDIIYDFLGENDNVIVECKCNSNLFIPYKIRKDKNKPNGEITINNTLLNIKEAITIKELF